MDQLYIYLRDFPAIYSSFELKWDHKICYHSILPTSVTLSGHKDEGMGQSCQEYWHVHDITIDNPKFEILHKCFNEAIEQLMTNADAQDSPLFLLWKKWTLLGLQAIQSPTTIKHTIQYHDLYTYMDHMTQFPPIQQQFKVEKCADNASIKYTMTLFEANATNQNLASLQLQFSHFMHYHDVKIAKLTAQLQDAMHTTRGYEKHLKHNISDQKLKLEQVANDIVLHTIGELNNAIQHTMTTFQSNMQGKSEAFELELNSIVDYMIQDVHAASEAGHHAMTWAAGSYAT